MAKQAIMTISALKKLLIDFKDEITDDFQIWLSSDEEGNEYLPMLENPESCLAIDKDEKRIVFYPSYR
ncbi:MAG: hypothetical protein A2Y10_10335 [Planctomycetes bacterium GWF2_41_51]|nr:MAG: hypothetical protein A2Y10_10335 [Planctomycetes bacterium GWF2_41_51]HBG27661.1 hypothetical protein [Phycisphaerales bacterium]